MGKFYRKFFCLKNLLNTKIDFLPYIALIINFIINLINVIRSFCGRIDFWRGPWRRREDGEEEKILLFAMIYGISRNRNNFLPKNYIFLPNWG